VRLITFQMQMKCKRKDANQQLLPFAPEDSTRDSTRFAPDKNTSGRHRISPTPSDHIYSVTKGRSLRRIYHIL
jgi:hypothetical protein